MRPSAGRGIAWHMRGIARGEGGSGDSSSSSSERGAAAGSTAPPPAAAWPCAHHADALPRVHHLVEDELQVHAPARGWLVVAAQHDSCITRCIHCRTPGPCPCTWLGNGGRSARQSTTSMAVALHVHPLHIAEFMELEAHAHACGWLMAAAQHGSATTRCIHCRFTRGPCPFGQWVGAPGIEPNPRCTLPRPPLRGPQGRLSPRPGTHCQTNKN